MIFVNLKADSSICNFKIFSIQILTAKLSQSNTAAAGSPDSSSDSSTGGSPQHAPSSYQGNLSGQQHHPLTAAAAEVMLPGVLMSRDKRINPFLCQLAELGSQLQHAQLRDAARNLLRQLPADPQAIERITVASQIPIAATSSNTGSEKTGCTQPSSELENIFMEASPSTILYHLEVCFLASSFSVKLYNLKSHYIIKVAYSLLMPANMTVSEKTLDFQAGFIFKGGIPLLLNMLSSNTFLASADVPTKRYFFTMKDLCKILMVTS